MSAIVSFTGHAVLALEPGVYDETLVELGADGFGGAHDPRLVASIAGPDAWIDSLDVLLVGVSTGPTAIFAELVPRPDLDAHPRARFAAKIRHDVQVYGFPETSRSAVVVLGSGLANLRELGFELEPSHRGGAGVDMVGSAMRLVPAGELVVSCVAPGNANSLRTLLTAGFTPIGSVQLFCREQA